MAKSKPVKAKERIPEKTAGAQRAEDTIVSACQTVEDTAVGACTQTEDKSVGRYLARGKPQGRQSQRLGEENGKK